MKHSRCIQAKLTIQVTLSKDAHSVDSMSPGKIVVKDVPDLKKSALNMQTFALGQKCIRQCRGSPMGSPLSPALCLMVVSISEQIWPINFKQILNNHARSPHQIRWQPPHFWRLTSSWSPTIWSTVGWRLLWETNHLGNWTGPRIPWFHARKQTLGTYLPRTYQILPTFLRSFGFRSRCHLVVKGMSKGHFLIFVLAKGLTS